MFSGVTDLSSREEEVLKSASGRFLKIIPDYRDQVSEQFLGLIIPMFFVGEERVRTVLGEATKKDDLLKKSVIPKRTQPEKQPRSNYGGTGSASRSGHRSKSLEVRK